MAKKIAVLTYQIGPNNAPLFEKLAGEKDLSKSLEEGADCFITKPFRAVDLLHEIKTIMQNKK